MAYDDKYEKYRAAEAPHNVIMENRKKISVSGALDVMNFDDGEIVMATSLGTLVLHGEGLRIEKLSLETGDVVVEGQIGALQYEDDTRQSGGLFSRLFK